MWILSCLVQGRNLSVSANPRREIAGKPGCLVRSVKEQQNQAGEDARTLWGRVDRLWFAEGLQEERAFRVDARFGSVVFHSAIPFRAQVVEPNGVAVSIDDAQEAVFQFCELSWINLALVNRVLHPLPIVEASLGSLVEPSPSRGSLGCDVVGDEELHFVRLCNSLCAICAEYETLHIGYDTNGTSCH